MHDVPGTRVPDAVELGILKVSPPVEVESSWFPPARWKTIFAHTLSRHEHNTISEVRASTQAVRHSSSSHKRWHQRVAILSDAGAAIGCLSKGRSCSRVANFLCRSAAAVIFACDLRLFYRWIASEHNVADGPSRFRETGHKRPGVAPGTARKAKDRGVKSFGACLWDDFREATSRSA